MGLWSRVNFHREYGVDLLTKSKQIAATNNRWFVLAILFVARFALGFQFQAAGSVTPTLLTDFGSNYADLGALVGLFMIPGLVFAIPSGFIGQRFGDRRVVLVSLLVLAFGGALSGLAGDYRTIAAGRVISGTGGVVLLILLTKMLVDWFADKELFLGMAIYIIGWPVGIAAGQVVQPDIAQTLGWRAAFMTATILCLIAFALIAMFYRSPANVQTAISGKPSRFTRSELVLINIAGLAWMFVNGAYLVLVSFGPILLDEQAVPFADAAQITSLMSWMFLFGLPLGGYLATRFGIPKTVLTVGTCGTLAVGVAIPYTDIPFVTFTVFGLLYALAAPVLGAMPAQILQPQNRAPGMGIYYVWYFLGSALMPVIAGYLNDMSGTATAPVLFAVALIFVTMIFAFVVFAAQRVLAKAPSSDR